MFVDICVFVGVCQCLLVFASVLDISKVNHTLARAALGPSVCVCECVYVSV